MDDGYLKLLISASVLIPYSPPPNKANNPSYCSIGIFSRNFKESLVCQEFFFSFYSITYYTVT